MIGPLTSGGGPFVVLAAASAQAWRGASDSVAYEAVCRGPDEGRITRIADEDAIVLGTPDNLYFEATPDGGVFARVVSFDADDDAHLAALLGELPDDGWQSMGCFELRSEALVIMDSALSGDDDERLEIPLAPGAYDLDGRTFEPDDGTELILNRLRRRA